MEYDETLQEQLQKEREAFVNKVMLQLKDHLKNGKLHVLIRQLLVIAANEDDMCVGDIPLQLLEQCKYIVICDINMSYWE